MVGQNAIFAAVVIGFIATIFGVFVWPFWNLLPDYVSEQVLVMFVDDRGRCIVQTADNYLIPIGQCNAQPGDLIVAEYDQKVKERLVQSIRGL